MRAIDYSDLLKSVFDDAGMEVDSDGNPNPDGPEWHQAKRAISRGLERLWSIAFWKDLLVTRKFQWRPAYSSTESTTVGDERWFAPARKYYLALSASLPVPPAVYADGAWVDSGGVWTQCERVVTEGDPWDATVAYAVGDRVQGPIDGKTYQAIADSTGQMPPNADYWSEVVPFVPYIARAQVGIVPIGRVEGVYQRDPRVFANPGRITFEDDSTLIHVNRSDLDEVWVRYLPVVPRLTGTFYDETASYTPASIEETLIPTEGLELASNNPTYEAADSILTILSTTDLDFYPIAVVGSPGAYTLAVGSPGDDLQNYRITGSTLMVRHAIDGTWHALVVTGTAEAPVIGIGAAGDTSVGLNFRVTASKLQLSTVSRDRWHSLLLVGDPPAVGLGPAES